MIAGIGLLCVSILSARREGRSPGVTAALLAAGAVIGMLLWTSFPARSKSGFGQSSPSGWWILIFTGAFVAALVADRLWSNRADQHTLQDLLRKVDDDGPFVRFRYARLRDRQAIIETHVDPESMQNNGWHEAEADAFRATMRLWRFHRWSRGWVVAIHDDGVVGVIGTNHSPDVIGLADDISLSMTVHPAHRRMGYGRVLGLAASRLATAFDVDVWIGTATANTAVRSIIEGLGFKGAAMDYDAPNGETFPGLWYLLHPGRSAQQRANNNHE